MKKHTILTFALILALITALVPFHPARADTIIVTTADDTLDAAANCGAVTIASLPGLDLVISLREAMCAANNNAGADTINFAIPGAGVHTIDLTQALPQIADDDTTIDGYSQPGAEPATATAPADIRIEIDGTGIFNNGLNVTSSGNEIRGLAIYGFSFNGIYVASLGTLVADDNVIAGNYLGIHADGVSCQGNTGNGIFIGEGALDNTVGGSTPSDRNLISCNGWGGVEIHKTGTSGNVVSGNYIGIDAAGTMSRANTLDGVRIYGGATNNTVGGDTPGERNVISGNERDGVRIVGVGTNDNMVSGNYIGLEPDGSNPRSNDYYGVYIGVGARSNIIGGDRTQGEANVISHNLVGVVIEGNPVNNTISNTVSGNYIGTDSSGLLAVGNFTDGIGIIGDAQNNLIGGDAPGESNLISGNLMNGIIIMDEETAGNVISGNLIGTDITGADSLPNVENGIRVIDGAHDNLIGGNTSGERNTISGNENHGVSFDLGATHNTVIGNFIGLDAEGLAPLPNIESGILISGAAFENIIGGDTAGARNVISGNGIYGLDIQGDHNTISGNYIGSDANGETAQGNADDGVEISGGAEGNLIGGDSAGERNIISGNGDDGIGIEDARENIISANYIGTNAAGTALLENADFGIYLSSGAQENILGGDTQAQGNMIAGGGRNGIYMAGATVSGNVVANNVIGTNWSGNADFGTGGDGIQIDFGAHHNTIGPGNMIANNDFSGIYVDDDTCLGNIFTQNRIYENVLLGIELIEGAHGGIQPPVIITTTFSPIEVTGTACPGCTVEVFGNSTDDGEGEVYLGSAVADGDGNFSVPLATLTYPYLTATATDATLGTSEFSAVLHTRIILLAYLALVLK
ncbi:MAG: right-handed parallel beta-helix repeat-containing protein [Anaerolineales bacterium]|nr:right-handed parallel beta-helix repeat-containing protein [Anaerolineales bacterium]